MNIEIPFKQYQDNDVVTAEEYNANNVLIEAVINANASQADKNTADIKALVNGTVPDESITTAKIAPLAVTKDKLSTDLLTNTLLSKSNVNNIFEPFIKALYDSTTIKGNLYNGFIGAGATSGTKAITQTPTTAQYTDLATYTYSVFNRKEEDYGADSELITNGVVGYGDSGAHYYIKTDIGSTVVRKEAHNKSITLYNCTKYLSYTWKLGNQHFCLTNGASIIEFLKIKRTNYSTKNYYDYWDTPEDIVCKLTTNTQEVINLKYSTTDKTISIYYDGTTLSDVCINNITLTYSKPIYYDTKGSALGTKGSNVSDRNIIKCVFDTPVCSLNYAGETAQAITCTSEPITLQNTYHTFKGYATITGTTDVTPVLKTMAYDTDTKEPFEVSFVIDKTTTSDTNTILELSLNLESSQYLIGDTFIITGQGFTTITKFCIIALSDTTTIIDTLQDNTNNTTTYTPVIDQIDEDFE